MDRGPEPKGVLQGTERQRTADNDNPRPRTGYAAAADSAARRDGSYREALGPEAWARVKPEIRARFAVRPAPGQRISYSGTMHTVELSAAGWLFAQACRLIGTPLAPRRGENVPMTIELHPDAARRGVAWHRIYHFAPDRACTVRSTKCKGGHGEFIEHIGCGFSMRLRLAEADGNLVFRSIAYEFTLLGRTLRIPDWLTPGRTTVTHEQLAGACFRFSLAVEHPLLGRTIFQCGEFRGGGFTPRSANDRAFPSSAPS